MPRVARLGDTHKGTCSHGLPCCPHNVTGTIIGGSNNVNTNGSPTARDGDNVIHNCPHCGTGYIVAGSSDVIVNGIRISKIGDVVIYPGGSGNIITSSDDVFADEL